MRCPRCKFNYSERILLIPVIGTYPTEPICGVCALEITRKFHKSPDYMFTGEIAKEQYDLALRELSSPQTDHE